MLIVRGHSQRQALELAQQLHESEMASAECKINVETPVRLLRAARESEVLREELQLQELKNRIHALEVELDQLLPRAQQELRLEMLPVEQAPQIVESAAKIFNGANLSIYGEKALLLGQLEPVFDILARAVRQFAPDADHGAPLDASIQTSQPG